MYMNARHISQQFFVHLLHVLMMSKVVIYHRHLTTAYTGTDIGHTVVVTNFLMLIVRIALTVLRSVHHNLPPAILVRRNQRTATRSRNHLVAIERQHAVLTKRTKHLPLIP